MDNEKRMQPPPGIGAVISEAFPFLKASTKAGLETYDHIQLTEEEESEALILAKLKKAQRLAEERRKKIEDENRRRLTGYQWGYKQTEAFMLWRAIELYEGSFRIDDKNKMIFELLCFYFSSDAGFVDLALRLGVQNPSLQKGIMLAGDYGVGKTWLMKLFCRNQRQTFYLRNAKEIADAYHKDGIETAKQYENKFENAFEDKAVFMQPFSGLCIDDLGTEAVKKNYGNERNVLGDLIELRYANKNTGVWLHATTNLNADQLSNYYGGRIRSRLREVFNVIEFKGEDRRR